MCLKLESLIKKYGDIYALRDIDMELDAGIYGLLGPNGAGKSTLINIIVGNLLQTSGVIRYKGTDIRKAGKSYRSLLGYMPQQQNLYPGFTGWDFLAYMAALKKVPKAETKEKIMKAASQVNIQDVLYRKLQTYSGGMRQRILLAAAVLTDPKLLILDEPTAGLDPRERIRIRNLISSMSGDRIILIATHVVSDVEHISKEIILLGGGRLIRKAATGSLTEEIRPYVREVTVPAHKIDQMEASYCVSNVLSDGNIARIRILSEGIPEEYKPVSAMPTLEDVYLYHFQYSAKQ